MPEPGGGTGKPKRLSPQAERQPQRQLRGRWEKKNQKKQRNVRCQLALCGGEQFPLFKFFFYITSFWGPALL